MGDSMEEFYAEVEDVLEIEEFGHFGQDDDNDDNDDDDDDKDDSHDDDKDDKSTSSWITEDDHANIDSIFEELVRDPPSMPPKVPPPHRRVIKSGEAAETGMNTLPEPRGRYAIRKLRKLRYRYRWSRFFRKLHKVSKERRQAHRDSAVDAQNPMLIQTRVVLRSEGQLPAYELAALHGLYRDINTQRGHLFSLSSAIMEHHGSMVKHSGGTSGTPDNESGSSDEDFLKQQVKMRLQMEEALFQAAKSANIMSTGDITIPYELDRFLEEFFDTWGMPSEAEVNLLARVQRNRIRPINAWFNRKEKRVEFLKVGYFKHWILDRWYNKLQFRRKKPTLRY